MFLSHTLPRSGTDYNATRRGTDAKATESEQCCLIFHARLFQSHLFVIFARTQNNL